MTVADYDLPIPYPGSSLSVCRDWISLRFFPVTCPSALLNSEKSAYCLRNEWDRFICTDTS